MPKFVHPIPFIIHPEDDLVEKQPHLRHNGVKLAHDFADGRVITEADLQAMGSALWHALPADTSSRLEEAIKAAGANILPIIVESPNPAVQALPWETLFHPEHGFLARHPSFTFSRRLASVSTETFPARPAPLKILLFTSLPDDLNPEKERLNVEKEQERVQEALLPFVVEGKVQLEMPDDGRLETLKDLLRRFEPHVLYLSGHGKFVHPPGDDRKPFGVFLFESEAGAGDPVTEDELAEALTGSGVQIVVISACESGKAASDDLSHGLARRLAVFGIPHVMGMRESVLDAAGIQFADALCKALANGERADVAIQAARASMSVPVSGISRREAGVNVSTERLRGQWCLPMLISPNPAQPAADWGISLTPVPSPFGRGGRGMKMRFVGRRKELRKYKHRLLTGALTRLFISGAGGHGKTALARKLARELEERGYKFFEWRADSPWRDFQQALELALDDQVAGSYDRFAIRMKDQPEKAAEKLFELLDAQYGGKAVLLFDNLEAIQDGKTFRLTDPQADAWLRAACSDKINLVVLATSRWVLPDWNGGHLPLAGMNKGDFLRLAQDLAERGQMNPLLLLERERLNRAYETLGHNPRGLEWLASATLTMDAEEEQAFAEKLAQTRADLRQNMALEETLRRLSAEAFALLRRANVYAAPVPAEGMIKLIIPPPSGDSPSPLGREGGGEVQLPSPLGRGAGGEVQPSPESALESLLAFSLLEVTENRNYEVLEYQVEPALLDYLREKNLLDNDPRAYAAAADYLLWLMEYERGTYPHLALTIEALRRAARHAEADRLTLDILVERYTLDGRYAELLTRWLPEARNSPDQKTQAEAIGQTGKLHIHIGDYETALQYLKQSLDIRRQIGDKAGEGTTLNNMATTAHAQGDYETALAYLKQSLDIMRQIGDKAGEGTTLNNISQIYDAQGDYETALAYLKQSLDIMRQIGDKKGEGATLNNISQIFKA
ncbi:MAG: tetratricopeptide repeat protein, partial [Chloroflexota bacterium]